MKKPYNPFNDTKQGQVEKGNQPIEMMESSKSDFNEDLIEIQRIEGGGPPKRVEWSVLPKGIRWFGYFIVAVFLLLVISVIVANILR